VTNKKSKEIPMKTKAVIGVSVVFLLLFVASLSFAQQWQGWRGSGGWGMGTNYQRMYNAATVETLSGTVVSIEKITPSRGMYYGIHLILKTDKETIPVHLGPAWYVERLDTKIEKGDHIQVSGSRVTFDGKPAIIAAEVGKGDTILKLRDDNGFPLWAGWRKK
jgi:hypothetical protein